MHILFAKVAYAQTTSLDTYIGKVEKYIVNPALRLLFAVALLVFLYGMFEFLSGAENEEKRTQGKKHMIWGLIGIFIMVAAIGIINLITATLGIT